MHIRRRETGIEAVTPAKINLFLEVQARRPDGYHELETVIAAVSRYDTLIFTPQARGDLELECRWGHGLAARLAAERRLADGAPDESGTSIPRGPENLVWRAADAVRRAANVEAGARIVLIKRIPAAAGLGGASSDCAATLVAANLAWGASLRKAELFNLAAQLGSDVPFFLSHGAAVCRGRGERLEEFKHSRLHAVVVRPPLGLKTAAVFRACRPAPVSTSTSGLLDALKRGNVNDVGGALANGLQQSAATLTPWIGRVTHELARQDVSGHHMSGSGSSCFALCRSARQARRVAARLQARRLGTVFPVATAAAP